MRSYLILLSYNTEHAIHIASAAATNSNRRIVSVPSIGHTLHFPNRKTTDTVPSLKVSHPKQVTEYASRFESAKMCISALLYVLFFATHRGKLKFEIALIPESHLFQSFSTFVATSLSHERPKWLCFGWSTNGCIKPSGSNMRLYTDKMTRLVNFSGISSKNKQSN